MPSNAYIFLTGFMAAGKTTAGRAVAAALHMPFIDLDEYIENQTGQSISSLFESRGEEIFRNTEFNCVVEILESNHPTVVALGGGTVCFHNVIPLLKEKGKLVYLKADVETLYDRILPHKAKRPLTAHLTSEGLRDFIEDMLEKRSPYYLQADIVVNADENEENVVREIIKRITK